MSAITMHFNLAEPIRSDEEMVDILGHMEAAGFQIGLMLDAAEAVVEDRRAADRDRVIDYSAIYPDDPEDTVDGLADGMAA